MEGDALVGKAWWRRRLFWGGVVVLCGLMACGLLWRQANVSAVLRGIEERGGMLYRSNFVWTRSLDKLRGKKRRQGSSGILREVLIHEATPEELGVIRGSWTINELYLVRGKVDQHLLVTLKSLPSLRGLSLFDFDVTDAELGLIVNSLRHPDQLRFLKLRGTSLTDQGLAVLSKCSALQSLLIDGSQIDGSGLSKLSGLPIRSLALDDSRVQDRNLELIVQQWGIRLTRFHVGDCPITDKGMITLGKLTALADLGIGGTKVTAKGFKRVMTGRSLSSLTLNELPWTVKDLRELPLGQSVISLNLSGWKISDSDLKDLPDLPKLIELDLSRTEVTDAGLDTLQKFPALLNVSVEGTDITLSGLESLKSFSSIVTVGLGRTGITCQELMELKDLGKINRIIINGLYLTDDELQRLGKKHENCTFEADDRFILSKDR